MGRKVSKKRRVAGQRTTKKKAASFKFISLSLSIFVVCLLLVVTGIILWQRNSTTSFCANSISCIKDLSGKVSTTQTEGFYMGKKVAAPTAQYFTQSTANKVLGASTDLIGRKHIYVDLTTQTLTAYEGSKIVFHDTVATGKWNLTPTGTFEVWIKLQATLMAGGEGATAYYLPNVPWTMYFYNAKIAKSEGYSLHGEYWYNPDTGLGKPESHGCVNMRISDAKALYDWVDPPTKGYTTYASPLEPGTLVTITGTTPNAGLVGTRFYNNNISPDAGSSI